MLFRGEGLLQGSGWGAVSGDLYHHAAGEYKKKVTSSKKWRYLSLLRSESPMNMRVFAFSAMCPDAPFLRTDGLKLRSGEIAVAMGDFGWGEPEMIIAPEGIIIGTENLD